MDVSNSKFVASRVIKLPPGFRFKPTDEELVVQYLKRKALGCPLPASVIPEINLSKYDPWDLPGDLEKEKYFFSRREAKYLNGDRCNRASGSGYWKATGIDKQIVSSRSNQTVAGMKKTLVFYRGKPPAGCKTEWIMHEYRLVSSSQNSSLQMENWVVCRIFLKKRRRRRDEDESQLESRVKPHFIDFMMLLHPPSSSSSCSASSGITEVSDHEENSPK